MAGASSTTVIDTVQAPSIDPSSVDSAGNGTAGAQIPHTSVDGAQAASVARWWLDIGYLSTLLGTRSSGTSSTAPGSSYSSRLTLALFAWPTCTSRDGRQAKSVSWSKIIAFAACVTTIVTVWPTHQSAVDGAKSLALSRWTAAKDYFEFCEEREWMPPNCDSVRSMPPGPPPDVRIRDLILAADNFDIVSNHSTITTLVAVSFVAWLLVWASRRKRLLPRRLVAYVLRRLEPEAYAATASLVQDLLRSPVPGPGVQDSQGPSSAVSTAVSDQITTTGRLRNRSSELSTSSARLTGRTMTDSGGDPHKVFQNVSGKSLLQPVRQNPTKGRSNRPRPRARSAASGMLSIIENITGLEILLRQIMGNLDNRFSITRVYMTTILLSSRSLVAWEKLQWVVRVPLRTGLSTTLACCRLKFLSSRHNSLLWELMRPPSNFTHPQDHLHHFVTYLGFLSKDSSFSPTMFGPVTRLLLSVFRQDLERFCEKSRQDARYLGWWYRSSFFAAISKQLSGPPGEDIDSMQFGLVADVTWHIVQ